MKTEVNPTFYQALAGAGRRTTPAELAKKGVRRLRTYKMSEVSFLIERALNKTLAQRMLSPMPAEKMAELSSAVEKEFKQQLGSVEELRASRGALKNQQSSAKRALTKFRNEVEKRRSVVAQSIGGQPLQQDISRVLKPLADQSSGPEWLAAGVTSDLQKLIENRVSLALERERQGYDQQVGKLERRIAKLVGTTETMEKALGSLTHSKEPDMGIASIYRTTQGISRDEGEADQKRAMMSDIFRANLQLRNQLKLVAQGA